MAFIDKIQVQGTGYDIIAVSAKAYDSTFAGTNSIKTELDSKVPTGRKVNGKALSADITLNAADVSAISTAARGAVNGVASLDANRKVPTGQLPDMQSLTAGTDLKIADNIISVNTDGTIGNSADMSFVAGSGTYASGVGAAAFGLSSIASGKCAFSKGESNSALASWSNVEGASNLASAILSHVEGFQNSAFAQAAHSEGYLTVASGNASHSEGADTHANGSNSHAEGGSTYANGNVSHAEGLGTSAVGDNSHAEGSNTLASGDNSHAEGNYTSAIGDYSHAGGSYTIASGDCSHTVGHYTKSYSDNSLVANFNNVAVGEATYANNVLDTSRISNNLTSWSAAATTMPDAFSNEGYFNLYNGGVNTAEFASYYGAMAVFGKDNTAMGRATMAIGYGNAAITPYSFVAGKGNYTTEYGQTVVGCWCEPSNITSARFIVGGGSSNTSRKNLLEVGDNRIYTPCEVNIHGNLSSYNHYVIGNISARDASPQMTLQYTGSLNAEICYSSTNPKLYFSGVHDGSTTVEGALVFTHYNTPIRFGTQLQSYYNSGIGGWFGFSMEDADCSGVGVVADLYSATYITATHTLAASTGSYAYGSNGSNVYGGTGTGCWYRNIGPSNNTAQSAVWSANVPAHKTIMITPTICFVRTGGGGVAGDFIVGLTNNNTPTGTSTSGYTSGNLNYINSQVEYLPLQFGPTGTMTHIMYNKTFYWTNTGTSTSNVKIRVAKSNNSQSGLRIEPRSVSWIII